ncbi:hypothetical protein ACXR0O_19295 [Verrucomicrobiota bacterium sgz303538]
MFESNARAAVGNILVASAIRFARTLSLLILLLGLSARAADLDLTFNADARLFGIGYGAALQSDGKLLVGGDFTQADGISSRYLARFNGDGTRDNEFLVGPSLDSTVRAIAVQPDGKILIGGAFTLYGATSRNRIARLNADGSLDTSFNPGTGFNGEVTSFAVQSDGKVVVVGGFTAFNGATRNRVARLNANGTLDTSFLSSGAAANDLVWDVALQSDGKPIIVGRFTSYNGTARNRIARLTTAGALDTTFNPGTGANGSVLTVAIDSSGRPIVGGVFSTFNNVGRACLAQLTTTGALDPAFEPLYGLSGALVMDVKLDSAGRIVVAGDFPVSNGFVSNAPGVMRFTGSTQDLAFNVPENSYAIARPGGVFQYVYAVAIGPDDSVSIVGGMFDKASGRAGVVRVSNSGSRDGAFNGGVGLGFAPRINAVRPGRAGAYYIAGEFDWIGGARRYDVARFLPNARLDTGFGADETTFFDAPIADIAERSDGRVWAFGAFTKIGISSQVGAALLDANGSWSFDPTLSVSGGAVSRAVPAANGKLYLAGTFTTVNGTARAGVARVDASGSLDVSFAPGSGPAGGVIVDAAVDSQDRLLVAGHFTNFSGSAEPYLVRLSPTGAVDLAFAQTTNLSAAVNSVQALAADKVLIGGIFANSGAYVVNGIDRLLADGSSDPSFNPGSGADSYVYAARADTAGRVLTVGAFSSIRGAARAGLARLETTGSIDPLFQSTTFGGGYPFDVFELPDGKLLVRGGFSSVEGVARVGLARFHSTPVRRGDLESALGGATLANGAVRAIVPQADGGFILAGEFTSISGTAANRVAKMNAFGKVDAAFAYGSGFNGPVFGGAAQPDGKILLWGAFSSYNGASASYLARLLPDGNLDASFTPPVLNSTVHALLRLDDGRLLIGGAFTGAGVASAGGLARLQANGLLDSTFNAAGGANGSVLALARAADGRIFAGGAFTTFGGASAPGVVKLEADGARSIGFDIGVGNPVSSSPVRALAVQNDGKLLVGGAFTAFSGVSGSGIVRLNPSGAIDPTFLSGLGSDAAVNALSVAAYGRIYVAGAFTTLGGGERRRLARLNPDGVIDPAFDIGAGFDQEVLTVTPLADGRVAAGGAFTSVNSIQRSRFAVLYGGDNGIPQVGNDQLTTIEVNPGQGFQLSVGAPVEGLRYQWFHDGQPIAGATGPDYSVAQAGLEHIGLYTTLIANGSGECVTLGTNVIVRLAPGIAAAPTAQSAGYGASATFTVGANGPGPFTYQWFRNGAPIGGATASSYTATNIGDADFDATFFVRITNAYGSTDSAPVQLTFDSTAVPGAVVQAFPSAPVSGTPNELVRTASGQYYVGGVGFLRRLNADGSIDPLFAPNFSSLTVNGLAVQVDGKLLVAGSMTPAGGSPQSLVRLLPSGALDPTFTPSSALSGSSAGHINAMVLQSDGKILIGGYFTTVAGVARQNLARLAADGSVDTGFAPANDASGPNDGVSSIYLQGANIIIGGSFTAYRGATVNRLVRITSTNALDSTFAGGARADGTISRIVAQSDGKLLVSGTFTTFNGTARNRLARLNADGSLDSTFDPGSGPDALSGSLPITGIAPGDNGTVVVVGSFTSFSGWPALRTVRLTSTGAIDTQWATPDINSNFVDLFAPGGGSLFVVGNFTFPGTTGSQYMARLLGGAYPPRPSAIAIQPSASSSARPAGSRIVLSALASGNGALSFQWLRNGVAVANSTTVTGATTPVLTLRSARASEAGSYTLRVTSSTQGFIDTNATPISIQPEATGPGTLDLTWAADPLPRSSTAAGFFADGSAIAAWYDYDAYPSVSYLRKLSATGDLLPASTFNPATGITGRVDVIAVQSDGKIIAAGAFDSALGSPRLYLARVNSNGTLDTTYNPAPNGGIYDILLQSDNKPILVGGFTTIAGQSRAGLARLLTTGAIDSTFVPGAHGLTDLSHALLAADGKIYLTGYNSTSGFREIVRLTSTGALDSTFARVSLGSGAVNAWALDSSNRLVLGGSFSSIAGQSRRYLARVSATGVLDSAYGSIQSSGPDFYVTSVLHAPDGWTYVLTDGSTYDGFQTGPLVRLDANGKLDVNFPALGAPKISSPDAGLAWIGGKLTLIGSFGGFARTQWIRINTDGGSAGAPTLLDSAGNRAVGEGNSVSLFAHFLGAGPFTYVWRKDGAVIAGASGPQLLIGSVTAAEAGTYTVTATNAMGSQTASMIVALLPPEPLSPTAGFALSSGFNGAIKTAARQADGAVVVGGNFTTVDGAARRGLARFTPSGNLDTAFNSALPFSSVNSVSVDTIAIEPDGRILVHGQLGMSDGTTAYLVRLNATGSLANVLLTAADTNAPPSVFARQFDGKMVLAGSFTTFAGVSRSGIGRLLATGAVDTTYVGPGFSADFTAIDSDSSGRVILGGAFTAVAGAPYPSRALRLAPDGQLDPTFFPPLFNGTVSGFYRSAAGIFFAYGQNLVQDGSISRGLVQLRENGRVEPGFACPVNFVTALAEDGAGRLFAARSGGLDRLLPAGGVDRSIPLSSSAAKMIGLVDRLILAGGNQLSSVNGVPVRGITFASAGPLETLGLIASPAGEITVAQGGSLVLRADVRGADGATFQWMRDDVAIPGASGPALVIENATVGIKGSYTLVVTSGLNQVVTTPAQVSVTSNAGREGEIDLAWGAGQSVAGVVSLFSDSTGRAYVAGNVNYNASAARPLVAVSSTGVPHADFSLTSRISGTANTGLVLPDGRILLGGSLKLDGVAANLLRIQSDGALDTAFTPGAGGAITQLRLLADGRILSIESNQLRRYGVNGAADGTPQNFTGTVTTVLSGPGGKLWALGSFSDASGVNRWLLRLNADGSRDATFAGLVLRSGESVKTARSVPDGGAYVLLNWGQSQRVVRITSAGEIDPEFDPGVLTTDAASTSLTLHDLAVDSSGRVLLAGNFIACDRVLRNGVVRLLPNGAPDLSFDSPAAVGLSSGNVPQQLLPLSDGHVLAYKAALSGYGGIGDRIGLYALHGAASLASAAPVVTGSMADFTLPPYDPLSISLPVWAPAGAQIQWFRDGVPIAGANGTRYALTAASSSASGAYHATVTTSGGAIATARVIVDIPSAPYSGALGVRNGQVRVQGTVDFAVRQPDGRILVISSGAVVNGQGLVQIFRLEADGSFAGALPTVVTGGSAPNIQAAAVDDSGRIYIGGSFSNVNGVTRLRVARLNPDGSLDTTWTATPSGSVGRLAVAANGKLVITGAFTQVGAVARQYLARLNADGSLDSSFAVGAGLDSQPSALVVQPDDRVVVGGSFTTYNGISATRLIRLDSLGGVDFSFAPAPNNTVSALALAPDGRILAAGSFSQIGGVPRTGLAWLDSAGNPLAVTMNHLSGYGAVALGSDGNVAALRNNQVHRFRPDGSLDAVFEAGNTYRGAFTNASTSPSQVNPTSLVLVGGEVLVAGPYVRSGAATRGGLAWLRLSDSPAPAIGAAPSNAALVEGGSVAWTVGAITSSGALTYTWSKVSDPNIVLSTTNTLTRSNLKPADAGAYRVVISNGEASTSLLVQLDVQSAPPLHPGAPRLEFYAPQPGQAVRHIAPASSGKWWAATSNQMQRLLADGSADPTFTPVTPDAGTIDGLHRGPDGRIYVWGAFTGIAGKSAQKIARFMADGQFDSSFAPAFPGTVSISVVEATASGQIYIGGTFSNLLVAGKLTTGIARLTETGALDESFDPKGGLNASALAIRSLPDGRVLAAGSFTQAAGLSRSGVARFLANGALDSSFNNLSVNSVSQLERLPDGKLLIAGSFNSVDGVNRSRLARLTADGVLDTAFCVTGVTISSVTRILPRPDGRIVIAGAFTENSSTRARIVQLLADGSVDPAFNWQHGFATTTSGSSASFTDAELLASGSILVAGNFRYIDGGIDRPGLALVQGTNLGPEILSTTLVDTSVTSGANLSFSVSASGAGALSYQWWHDSEPITGATAATLTLSDVDSLDTGNYYVVLSNSYGSLSSSPAMLTVVRRAQSISFQTPGNRAFTSEPFAISASADSGLPVVFEVISGDATINGSLLTLHGIGTITLRATQPGNAAYAAAAAVERSFTVEANFQSWQRERFTVEELANPAVSGPTADPDRDGRSNFLEYAFASNPRAFSADAAPVAGTTIQAGAEYLTITFVRRAASTELVYTVQSTGDVNGTWTAGPVPVGTPIPRGDGTETVTYRDTTAISASQRRFLRISVQQSP